MKRIAIHTLVTFEAYPQDIQARSEWAPVEKPGREGGSRYAPA